MLTLVLDVVVLEAALVPSVDVLDEPVLVLAMLWVDVDGPDEVALLVGPPPPDVPHAPSIAAPKAIAQFRTFII